MARTDGNLRASTPAGSPSAEWRSQCFGQPSSHSHSSAIKLMLALSMGITCPLHIKKRLRGLPITALANPIVHLLPRTCLAKAASPFWTFSASRHVLSGLACVRHAIFVCSGRRGQCRLGYRSIGILVLLLCRLSQDQRHSRSSWRGPACWSFLPIGSRPCRDGGEVVEGEQLARLPDTNGKAACRNSQLFQ